MGGVFHVRGRHKAEEMREGRVQSPEGEGRREGDRAVVCDQGGF